jgi:hypothetical protein
MLQEGEMSVGKIHFTGNNAKNVPRDPLHDFEPLLRREEI